MAEPPSLGDFFAKKKTKKVKPANLNNVPSTAEKKPEKKKEKDEEAAQWKEEAVPVAPTIRSGIEVGKLVREEDEVEETSTAPAWGKVGKEVKRSERDEKRFPDLRAAVGFMPSSNINIDDGSDAKINITTNKNAFAALEGDEEEDDDGSGNKKKRPKEIKPAMVSKQKGEREKDVLKKEIDKYVPEGPKKDTDEPQTKDQIEAAAKKAEKKAEKEERKSKSKADREDDDKENENNQQESPMEVQEDCRIAVDEEKAKQKYMGRKKLPKKDIPAEELEDPNQKKPKKKFVAVEDF